MPEIAFLQAVSSFIAGLGLQPAPVSIGTVEPANQNNQVPAITLSLDHLSRPGASVGGGAEPMTGVLTVHSTIDLESPLLPGDPDFSLLSPDRQILTLPHGGLVRDDGTEGALGASDIQVQVAGAARTLVAEDPDASEFTADPLRGVLQFGAPLPANGVVDADYRLGHWERTVQNIEGSLVLTVYAAQGADADSLSGTLLRSLLGAAGGNGFPGLKKIRLRALGPVKQPPAPQNNHLERTAQLDFAFEHIVDAAASSGGIIHEIPVTTELNNLRLDQATGVVVEETEIEPS